MNLAELDIWHQIRNGARRRIVAFGSSNTERYAAGTHWLDGLELAIRGTLCSGRKRNFHCINSGISGDTTRDLLARFNDDVAIFQPHLTLVTIGGNDSKPKHNMSPQELSDNLKQLYRRLTELGSEVVFQTYYAPLTPVEEWERQQFPRFHAAMEQVREVAAETGAGLIDYLARWEPLRLNYPQLHAALMLDSYHVIELCNKVLALNVARTFGLHLGGTTPAPWQKARAFDILMDELL